MKLIYQETTINYIAQVNFELVNEIVNSKNAVIKQTESGIKYILFDDGINNIKPTIIK